MCVVCYDSPEFDKVTIMKDKKKTVLWPDAGTTLQLVWLQKKVWGKKLTDGFGSQTVGHKYVQPLPVYVQFGTTRPLQSPPALITNAVGMPLPGMSTRLFQEVSPYKDSAFYGRCISGTKLSRLSLPRIRKRKENLNQNTDSWSLKKNPRRIYAQTKLNVKKNKPKSCIGQPHSELACGVSIFTSLGSYVSVCGCVPHWSHRSKSTTFWKDEQWRRQHRQPWHISQ